WAAASPAARAQHSGWLVSSSSTWLMPVLPHALVPAGECHFPTVFKHAPGERTAAARVRPGRGRPLAQAAVAVRRAPAGAAGTTRRAEPAGGSRVRGRTSRSPHRWTAPAPRL